ncbi:tripartite motif-containing protein 35-like [Mastacembelus armatus]|uniref:Tripartite motif-containing protein 35-like n=1 Tax=Mastacembelus armatus TaxID=205130 RepID=A0A3Q3LZF8_9TELE|nr:tripartite motif-containing protein 35-like [Mastacembelus armatus]
MASESGNDLTCSVCHDIFKEPVLLKCSHSFCKICVKRWWRQKQTRECPICKAVSGGRHPPRNLALNNLCEAFLLERAQPAPSGSEDLCSLHSEKLRLFCLDHQQPVCVVCRDSKTHNNHRFRPINEAAQDHREEILKSLKPLQEKLKLFEQAKGNCDQTAEHIKFQARQTEKQIKEQFKKLHQFLQEEEEARITALREDEGQKSQMMKEKIEALSREITALSDTVRATEEELRAEEVSFLQNYKAAVRRVQQRLVLDDPQSVLGARIDVAKYRGNLTFNIWNKMKALVSYTPVILDPNTVHPYLILSEDLTTVNLREHQRLPENPERLNLPSVLGSEGFDSGTHSWDVEIGDSQLWCLGVAAKSFQSQTGKYNICRLHTVTFSKGKYIAFFPSDLSIVLPVQKLQKIRVHLDCDKGKVSFSDPDTNTQIHTATHTFTEKVFPIFCGHRLIKILPKTLPVVSDDAE